MQDPGYIVKIASRSPFLGNSAFPSKSIAMLHENHNLQNNLLRYKNAFEFSERDSVMKRWLPHSMSTRLSAASLGTKNKMELNG